MSDREIDRRLLSVLSEYLLSLPFDLKILQEAVSDPDLERESREVAAGVIVHALSPHEGEVPHRYIEDALFVRVALSEVKRRGGEAFGAFHDRFAEVYAALDRDLETFSAGLGADNWRWIEHRVETFPRMVYKGKHAADYVDDEEGLSFLYEEGLEFETNYTVTEEQVHNRLRRAEQIVEHVARKRQAEEAKKLA